jgi:hypothetical protein
MRKTVFWAVLAVWLFLLGACGSSYHARDMTLRTTFVNPAILEKGTGDQALYRYMNNKIDILSYDKILLEPVMVTKDGKLDAATRENYQRLANNAYAYLSGELSKDYTLVKSAQPGAMRLSMGILDADPSEPVRNVLASLTPIGMAVNLVTYSGSGKQSGVGEVSMEMKVTDSVTGELMGAAVDRRVGGTNFEGVVDTWADANAGLEWWAKRTRYFLCLARAGKGCQKP